MAAFAAILVLLGWQLHVQELASLGRGLASMKPNTAAGMLLLGLSLAWQARDDRGRAGGSVGRWAARAAALLAMLIGAATLLEYALGVELGIDGLLFRPGVTFTLSESLHPARPAPTSALALTLLGASLGWLDFEPRPGWRPAQGLAILAAATATVALVGYLYGVPSLYAVGPFASIALHTALLMLLLSLGALAARPREGLMATLTSERSGGLLMRRLLPLALVLPFFIGWLRLLGQRAGWYDTVFGLAIFATSNAAIFAVLVWWTARSLDRLDVERAAALERALASKLAEEKAGQELDRIQEANRLKSEFLANMSHELRTPLNAIIGFADLMYKGKVGPLAEEHREYVGDILTSSRHLLQLINDVLDLAKVEAGKMEFRPEPVDPGKLVGEVVGILRGMAASKRLAVETRLDPSLGEVVVDPARVKQVLYNFLSNALKFTPEHGRVVIALAAEEPDQFRLSVEDSGIGIAPHDLGRLFVEFQQLDATTAKRFQGTGLGLALTRRIVEAQGGRVEVRSELGKGSTFAAILPRRTVALAAAAGARSTPAPASATDGPRGKPVLVLEDDPTAQRLVAAALGELGCRTLSVYSADEALRVATVDPPQLIVLDLLMPDVDGFEFLERFQALGLGPEVPIVVWTIKDLTTEERSRFGPSVRAVIGKGAGDISSLVETVRPLLEPGPGFR